MNAEKWNNQDIATNLGWTLAQVEAAAGLGLGETKLRVLNDSPFTQRAMRVEAYRLASHVREWAATAKAVMPRRLPGSFAVLTGESRVAVPVVCKAIGWTREQFVPAASALNFPPTRTRQVVGPDGVARIVEYAFCHEVDSWLDRVREFLGHGVAEQPPAA